MKLLVGATTHVGRVRAVNQDAFLAEPPFFVVADGLGGHQGGEVASATAVAAIRGRIANGSASDPRFLTGLLRDANQAILERAGSDPALQGMGTTCTLLAMDGARGLLAHVGDTRAYLFRDGTVSQLTADHTLVARMVEEGQLSEDEARVHPVRSSITRALGFDPAVEVDIETVEARPGDRLLLSSDGLHGLLDADHIGRVLRDEPSPQLAADRLVELANEAGGDDNITALVVDIPAESGRAPVPAADSDDSAPTRPVVLGDPPATIPIEMPRAASAPTGTEASDPSPRGARRSRAQIVVILVVVAVIAALVALALYLLVVPPPPVGGLR